MPILAARPHAPAVASAPPSAALRRLPPQSGGRATKRCPQHPALQNPSLFNPSRKCARQRPHPCILPKIANTAPNRTGGPITAHPLYHPHGPSAHTARDAARRAELADRLDDLNVPHWVAHLLLLVHVMAGELWGSQVCGWRSAERGARARERLHRSLWERPTDRAELAASAAVPERAVWAQTLYSTDASWDAMLCPHRRLRRFQVRRRVGRARVFRTTRREAKWLGWGARQAVEALRCGLMAECVDADVQDLAAPILRAREAGVREAERRRGGIAGFVCSASAELGVLGEWQLRSPLTGELGRARQRSGLRGCLSG